MCLLIAQNNKTTFTLADFEDFVNKNPDGFGMAIPAGKAGVKVFKLTPNQKRTVTADPEAINDKPVVPVVQRHDEYDDWFGEYYTASRRGNFGTAYVKPDTKPFAKECFELWEREAKGKLASLHFRFRTHGDISDENAHPYKVLSVADGDPVDIWLMHNGTFSTGNAKDHQKSDTWHIANRFLRPILLANPKLIEESDIFEFIAEFIGSNKITLTTAEKVYVLNQHKGSSQKVYDAWLSNDYAWTKPYVAQQHSFTQAAQTKPAHGGSGIKRTSLATETPTAGKTFEMPNVSCWRKVAFNKDSKGDWNFTKQLTLPEMNSLLFADYKGFIAACKVCLTDKVLDVVLKALATGSTNYNERSRAVYAIHALVTQNERKYITLFMADAANGKLDCMGKAA